jgi:hypothetical protein
LQASDTLPRSRQESLSGLYDSIAGLSDPFKGHSARLTYQQLQIARSVVMDARIKFTADALLIDAPGTQLEGDPPT